MKISVIRHRYNLTGCHSWWLFQTGYIYRYRYKYRFLPKIFFLKIYIIFIYQKFDKTIRFKKKATLTPQFPRILLAFVPDCQIWQLRNLKDALLDTGLRYEPPDTVKITTNGILSNTIKRLSFKVNKGAHLLRNKYV